MSLYFKILSASFFILLLLLSSSSAAAAAAAAAAAISIQSPFLATTFLLTPGFHRWYPRQLLLTLSLLRSCPVLW
jgi:hypothetical protein